MIQDRKCECCGEDFFADEHNCAYIGGQYGEHLIESSTTLSLCSSCMRSISIAMDLGLREYGFVARGDTPLSEEEKQKVYKRINEVKENQKEAWE